MKKFIKKIFGVFGSIKNSIPKIQIKNKKILIVRETEGETLTSTIKRIIYVFIFVAILHSFLFLPYIVQSESMEPTLYKGDYLLVSKYSYGYNKHSFIFQPQFKGVIFKRIPKRGDVIVFRSSNNNVNYIKRIVGLPNDTIQMKREILYINKEPVPRKLLKIIKDSIKPHEQYEEILPGGKVHNILHIADHHFADNTHPYKVPENHYFLIGDNRDDSVDSRFSNIGFISHEDIIGKANLVLFSSKGYSLGFWRWLIGIRGDRFFKVIK